MAVFRVERNNGYTVMSNHHLRNKELTLKAKGLLSQKLRPDTVLENFPLFCPKCKQETLISVKDMKVSAIKKGVE